MKKSFIAALLLLITVPLLLMSSIEFILPDEQGVVYRFGKFNRILMPGIKFRWPEPIERVTVVSVYSLREMQGRWCCLANPDSADDAEKLQLFYDVEWRVKDAKTFVENGSDAERKIVAIMREELASQLVPSPTTLEFFQKRDVYQTLIEKRLQKQLAEAKTGVIVLRVVLKTVHRNS